MVTRRTVLTTATALLAPSGAMVRQATAEPQKQTPKAAGFVMPIESEPHRRTFMQWPSDPAIYGGPEEIHQVRVSITEIANTIQKHEQVAMLVPLEFSESAYGKLDRGVEIWPITTQDLWARDSGPTFVVNATRELAVSDLNFNGWGNRQKHEADSEIAKLVAEKMNIRRFENSVVGEGGGVETDGEGTLLAHASSWLNPNRNAVPQDILGTQLCDALGADKIIWAPGVMGADITDYHIDALARFVKPGQVLIQLPEKPVAGDPWSKAAFETYEILKQATDAKGRKLDIVVIPEPVDMRERGANFVASYVNYYVCNGAVIMSQFGDSTADAKASELLGQLYPARTVISLNADAIGRVGGGIHCTTQQQPKR